MINLYLIYLKQIIVDRNKKAVFLLSSTSLFYVKTTISQPIIQPYMKLS